MKKHNCLIVLLVLLLTLLPSVALAAETATKTASKVTVDGVVKSFDAYNINGNNYFKLRDIAYILSGTSKEFEVTWDGSKNAIDLLSNKPYTRIGGEMVSSKDENIKSATLSTSKIYLNGKEIKLTAYTIEGNNYFKLRDLGSTFDFGVEWDGKNNTIVIESAMHYVPTDSTATNLQITNTHKNHISNWASISSVQQFSYKNEGLAYAYIENNRLQITTPNKQLTIEVKYPLLGDIISDDDGNFYIVWGKEGVLNTDETIFISKYSPEGAHIKTLGFVGKSVMGADGNTQIPFDAGNCVSAIGNGYLMVNYARLMYSGHQSNNVIGINLSDITPIKHESLWDIPYTSHSFNQSVIWSENSADFIYADHGDAYDRGFVVTSDAGEKLLFTFYLESNANYNMFVVNRTFAQLGGLAETSKGVVLVGASAKSIGESAKKESQNLFVQIFNPHAQEVSPSMFVGGTTRTGTTSFDINDNNNGPLTKVTDYGVHWLTNYTDTNVIAPQVVVANDHIVILWATENDTFYMVLSANGDILTPATSLGGIPLNSFERPVYHNGAVYWTYAYDGKLRIRSIKL